jgi:hypothetical protein
MDNLTMSGRPAKRHSPRVRDSFLKVPENDSERLCGWENSRVCPILREFKVFGSFYRSCLYIWTGMLERLRHGFNEYQQKDT